MSNLNLFEKGTNHMTRRNTELRNGGSEFDASLMSLRPCVGDIVVDDGTAEDVVTVVLEVTIELERTAKQLLS